MTAIIAVGLPQAFFRTLVLVLVLALAAAAGRDLSVDEATGGRLHELGSRWTPPSREALIAVLTNA